MFKYIFFLALIALNSLMALEPVIIVLGPPGCGKGNFSQFLKDNYQYNHLGAGDLVRREIEQKTPIGLQIADVVKRGDYIDVQIMRSLMDKAVCDLQSKKKPFTIDGFGGNDQDIEFLHRLLLKQDLLPRTIVLFFDADDNLCKTRMSSRLVCKQCEQIYNKDTIIPKVEGQCDLCTGELVQRSNETPEIIAKRLFLYRQRVEPNYKKALDLFPSILYRTDGSLDECKEFYKDVVIKIAHFQGSADEFIDSYKSDSIPHATVK